MCTYFSRARLLLDDDRDESGITQRPRLQHANIHTHTNAVNESTRIDESAPS